MNHKDKLSILENRMIATLVLFCQYYVLVLLVIIMSMTFNIIIWLVLGQIDYMNGEIKLIFEWMSINSLIIKGLKWFSYTLYLFFIPVIISSIQLIIIVKRKKNEL